MLKRTKCLSAFAVMAMCLISWNKGDDGGEGFIPAQPDYADSTLWISQMGDKDGTGADIFYIVSTWEEDWTTSDGRISHYADVYNTTHHQHMNIEQTKVAAYMGTDNNFCAPLYRHMAMGTWLTRDEKLIKERFMAVAMQDVKRAFRYFNAHRDTTRPLVIAGFSQGGKATVELIKMMDEDTYQHLVAAYVMGYKVTPEDTMECKRFRPAQSATDTGVVICYNTVKDAKYVVDVIAKSNTMCINPVNWRTDATPAILDDSVTVSVDTQNKVLIVQNYAGSEYRPYKNFINVGDIHSCEPWLYSKCIRHNINERVKAWRAAH